MAKLGKGSSIIAVIALIIGLGAGGFIIYDNFIASPPPPPPAENQWYEPATTVFSMQPGEAWGTISSISIDFNITSGQNVYFSFIVEINFDDSSNPTSYVEIHFEVDGIMWSQPRIYVQRYNIPVASAHGLRMSASLQHYNTTMTSGTHTVTLVYKGSSTADSVRSGSLFVQTFN